MQEEKSVAWYWIAWWSKEILMPLLCFMSNQMKLIVSTIVYTLDLKYIPAWIPAYSRLLKLKNSSCPTKKSDHGQIDLFWIIMSQANLINRLVVHLLSFKKNSRHYKWQGHWAKKLNNTLWNANKRKTQVFKHRELTVAFIMSWNLLGWNLFWNRLLRRTNPLFKDSLFGATGVFLLCWLLRNRWLTPRARANQTPLVHQKRWGVGTIGIVLESTSVSPTMRKPLPPTFDTAKGMNILFVT